MLMRSIFAATAAALVVVAVAGGATPDATLLVLQPADVNRPLVVGSGAPQLTSTDGELSVPAKYGRQAGALSSFVNEGGISAGVGPTFLTSRTVVFRDAAGAHAAFLEVSAKLAKFPTANETTVELGQEAHRYAAVIVSRVLWRQGNVLGFIDASGGRGPGTDPLRYAQLQQARIAVLVPSVDPGPLVVVKPVIGKPAARPFAPVSSKRFTAVFPVTRSDDGKALIGGTLVTSVKLASTPIAHQYGFRNGTVTLALTIPRTARGKRLKIMVKVTTEGETASKTAAYKVR